MDFIAEHWLGLLPLALILSTEMFRLENRARGSYFTPGETSGYRAADWLNLVLVVASPILYFVAATIDIRAGATIMAGLQFYMFITHLAWSVGYGEPGYLHFGYVPGKTVGRGIMAMAIYADLASFMCFVDYAGRANHTLSGPFNDLFIWWNVFSHVGEFCFIHLDAGRFYVYVFGPDPTLVPMPVAWLKWAEGWIDSIGHLYAAAVAMRALETFPLLLSVFLPSVVFMATLAAWDSVTMPAYLGLVPPLARKK